MSAVLPWFRVHIVILNDLGRLISSHALYELITIDPTSNLIWTYEKLTYPIFYYLVY